MTPTGSTSTSGARVYSPAMDEGRREELYKGWQAAVRQALTHD